MPLDNLFKLFISKHAETIPTSEASIVSIFFSESKTVPSEGRPRGKLLDFSLFSGGRREEDGAGGLAGAR